MGQEVFLEEGCEFRRGDQRGCSLKASLRSREAGVRCGHKLGWVPTEQGLEVKGMIFKNSFIEV